MSPEAIRPIAEYLLKLVIELLPCRDPNSSEERVFKKRLQIVTDLINGNPDESIRLLQKMVRFWEQAIRGLPELTAIAPEREQLLTREEAINHFTRTKGMLGILQGQYPNSPAWKEETL